MNEWASASTTWHGMAWPGLVGWLGYLVWGWDWDWLTLTDWGKVSDIECGNSLWRTWNDRTVVNFWMVPQILKLFFGLMFWVVVAGCVKGRRAATTNRRLWLRSSRFFFVVVTVGLWYCWGIEKRLSVTLLQKAANTFDDLFQFKTDAEQRHFFASSKESSP